MKNFIFVFSISLFLPVLIATAIEPGEVPTADDLRITPSPIDEPNQLLSIIAAVVKWTYIVFFIVAVLFIVFAAFNYLSGGNEPEKIKTAHSQIMYAAIAIAMALLAVGVQAIVKNFLEEEKQGGVIMNIN